jgi:hypothetical protein
MTDLPHLSLYRRATAAAFALGTALFLVDNLIHPKEYATDHEAEQLAEIAGNYTRWQLAHVLALVAIFLLAVAILGLTFLVRRRAPTAGLVGGVLAMAGVLGFAGVVTLDGFAWGVLGEVSARGDARTAAEALHDLQQSEWSLPYYLPALGFLFGLFVLAVTAARTGALPVWTGAALALASVLVGLEGAIHSNAFFIAGAVVFLVAGLGVAAAVGRMSDAEFAGQAGMGSRASAP